MKYLLSISLLICSLFCKGQDTSKWNITSYDMCIMDSGKIIMYYNKNGNHRLWLADGPWFDKYKKSGTILGHGETGISLPIGRHTDTLKIIYQYSYTASVRSWIYDEDFIKKLPDSVNWRYLSSTQYIKDTLYLYDHSVRWSYGYLVIVSDIHSSLEHYLDAEKNKLWKNIIVWKYIEIQ